MDLQALWTVLIYLLSALVSLGVGMYAFRRRLQPGAGPLAAMTLLEVVWILGYVSQLVSPGLEAKLFWNDVQFLGAVLTPLVFLVFAAEYGAGQHPFSGWVQRGLGLAAVLMLAIIWTDGVHHLFRTDPHLVASGPFVALVFGNGPLFVLFPFVGYIPIIFGVYILTSTYISAPRIYRMQVITVLAGILIPWITTVITWLNWIPIGLHEITPLSFGLSNLVIAWALFHYGLFELVPVAHATLVENMEDGVLVVDSGQRIVDINPAAQRILEIPARQALGRIFPGGVPALQSITIDRKLHGVLPGEIRVLGGQESRTYEVFVSVLPDARRQAAGRLIQLRDVTHRKQAEERLRTLAITDPLTGLFNRRHFFAEAERELEHAHRSGEPLGLLIFDIDHFKQVNDINGHLAGDAVLHTLAVRCLEQLRPYDLIARYGGEEFVVLAPGAGTDQACHVGERLRQAVADPMPTDWGEVCITISVGAVTSQNLPECTLDGLLERADQALYQAKQDGRNHVRLWEKR